jgi:hypothetical protein
MINAPIYIDAILGVLLLVTAGTQCTWIAFHGHALGRWLQAIGWSGLSVRILWSIAHGNDPMIAAVSIPLLLMAAGGATLTAVGQMRMLWMDVRCLQRPEHRCFREDRVKAAILERRR